MRLYRFTLQTTPNFDDEDFYYVCGNNIYEAGKKAQEFVDFTGHDLVVDSMEVIKGRFIA